MSIQHNRKGLYLEGGTCVDLGQQLNEAQYDFSMNTIAGSTVKTSYQDLIQNLIPGSRGIKRHANATFATSPMQPTLQFAPNTITKIPMLV